MLGGISFLYLIGKPSSDRFDAGYRLGFIGQVLGGTSSGLRDSLMVGYPTVFFTLSGLFLYGLYVTLLIQYVRQRVNEPLWVVPVSEQDGTR